jgi:hypothetical protein
MKDKRKRCKDCPYKPKNKFKIGDKVRVDLYGTISEVFDRPSGFIYNLENTNSEGTVHIYSEKNLILEDKK